MKKTKLTSLLIQGGLLLAFSSGFYVFTQMQVKPMDIYVYTKDISANTVLQESDLSKKTIPADAVTKNMITDKKDAVGKVVATKVYPGQYAIKQNLIEENEVDPFEKIDLSTYRKISIAIEMEDAVGGNLKRGDRVDLSFVASAEVEDEDKEFTYAKTFMQDILVYNVVDDNGKKYVDQTESTGVIDGEEIESGTLAVVTLAVTGDQAEEIQARMEKGKIKILGRFESSENNETKGYTLGEYGTVSSKNVNPESR